MFDAHVTPDQAALSPMPRDAPVAERHDAAVEVPVPRLAALAMLSTAAADMVVPLLRPLADDLPGRLADISLVVSLLPAGSAIAQLLCGPMSDRLGRRKVLLTGSTIYVLATIGCALSDSLSTLAWCRLFVGAGAGTCLSIAFAVIRDTTTGARMSSSVATVTGAMWAFSIVGVPLASALLAVFGWRSVFWAMSIASGALTALLALRQPETLPAVRRCALSARGVMADYRCLLRSRSYRAQALSGAMAFSVLFTIAIRAGTLLSVAPARFGYCYATVIAGLSVGSLLCPWLLRRQVARSTLQAAGTGLMWLGGSALAIGLLVFPEAVRAVWGTVPLLVLSTIGVGVAAPCSIAGAVSMFPMRAGTASSLLGIIRMGVAAAVSAIVGFVAPAGPLVSALVIVACGTVAIAAWPATRHGVADDGP